MSVPILNNANRILSAVDEGIIRGIIFTLDYQNVPITSGNVTPILKSVKWDDADIEYWLTEYQISE